MVMVIPIYVVYEMFRHNRCLHFQNGHNCISWCRHSMNKNNYPNYKYYGKSFFSDLILTYQIPKFPQ